jgi:aspartyl-tRNA(Asn)/glutamyl-tRNA(Gln) amidotransferase subunit A
VKPLHTLSATELLAAYARGDTTPVAVVQAVLAQVQRCDGALHATWALDAEAALQQAQSSTQRWQQGATLALDGVPVTIKENIATVGVAVPLGTAATVLKPAMRDAPPAARLREAGAVILGKTTMPDWGMLSSGLSSFHATARNPWDARLTPGGSSAGAGAACAAGYGPLHLGTDIGGSVRLPAAWCGINGFKPSLGRIPIDPPYAARVAGPMTRTVADAALLMQVLSQPDVRDTMSLPAQPLDWASVRTLDAAAALASLRGLRVGLWLDAGVGMPVAAPVLQAIEAAAAKFQAAGAVVARVSPFLTRDMIEGLDRFWRMRSWLEWQTLSPAQQAHVLPYIRDWVAPGARYSGADVFTGYSQMASIRDATVAATAPFDVVLSPTAPCVAFAAELASPINDPTRPFEHIAFTVAFSMSEQPAISVNAGFDGSKPKPLPVGLQISGRRHDDLGVLRAARAWEALRGAMLPWPMDESPVAAWPVS